MPKLRYRFVQAVAEKDKLATVANYYGPRIGLAPMRLWEYLKGWGMSPTYARRHILDNRDKWPSTIARRRKEEERKLRKARGTRPKVG